MRELTTQEQFWQGDFGNDYVRRNVGMNLVASNIAMFARILDSTENVKSIIEFGSNIGLNLIALHQLVPDAELTAVEINKEAFSQLEKLDYIEAYHGSFYDLDTDRTYDIAFTKGVLIHQAPEILPKAYDLLYNTSRKYILIAEYYNPTPMEVTYRGNTSVLYKRDFSGELLDRFSDLYLVDYQFIYHGDNQFPQDDITWFLLKKGNTD